MQDEEHVKYIRLIRRGFTPKRARLVIEEGKQEAAMLLRAKELAKLASKAYYKKIDDEIIKALDADDESTMKVEDDANSGYIKPELS